MRFTLLAVSLLALGAAIRWLDAGGCPLVKKTAAQ